MTIESGQGHIPPASWWSAFNAVDRTDAAADLLEYSELWRTPDGSERMPPLTMQQAQVAADTVLAFLNDAVNRNGTGSGYPGEAS